MKKVLFVIAVTASIGLIWSCKSEKSAASKTKEDTAATKVECDPSITFTATILPIFEAKCTKCHSGPKPAHRIDLTTLAGAQAGVAHNLMCTITSGPCPKMPPGGNEKLTDEEVQKVDCWIKNGMKN